MKKKTKYYLLGWSVLTFLWLVISVFWQYQLPIFIIWFVCGIAINIAATQP